MLNTIETISIYIFTIIILVLFSISKNYFNLRNNSKSKILISILAIIIISITFTLRRLDVGTDTVIYSNFFNSGNPLVQIFILGDPIFFLLIWFFKFIGGFVVFSFFNSLLLGFCIYKYAKKSLPENWYLLFIFYLSFFIFITLNINLLRTGLAISFFLFGISNKNPRLKLLFYILSAGTHLSLLFVIIAYETTRIINLRWSFIVNIIAICFSYSNFQIIPLVNDYIKLPDRISKFALESAFQFNYKVGFRWEFFIFNLLFLLYFLYVKKFKKNSNLYTKHLIAYINLSSVFYVMFSYPFSDRYGLLSWIFMPFLIVSSIEHIKGNKILIIFIMFVFNIALTIYFIQNLI